MDIESSIREKKELYQCLFIFLNDIDNSNEHFKALTQILIKQEINETKIKELFCLISKLESNHHRSSRFYDNLEQVFRFVINNQYFSISNNDIFQIFKDNKRILLLLLHKKLIIPDDNILKLILKKKDINGFKYCYYLYPVIKSIIGKRSKLQMNLKYPLKILKRNVSKAKMIQSFAR